MIKYHRTAIHLLAKFIMLIFCLSCTQSKNSDVWFHDVELPLNIMNKKLSIVANENHNSFKTGDVITLFLYNSSTELVRVRPQDIRIFEKIDNTWMEIANNEGYASGFETVISKSPSDMQGLPGSLYYVLPDAVNKKSLTSIRIIVIGVILDNDYNPTDKKVGAYLDLVLSP